MESGQTYRSFAHVFYISNELLHLPYTTISSEYLKPDNYRYLGVLGYPEFGVTPDDVYMVLQRDARPNEPNELLDDLHERSMSAGDILYMGDIYWLCALTGWERVMPSEFTMALYQKTLLDRPILN